MILEHELTKKITEWAEARNIIKGSTPEAQLIKLYEEMGELAAGIAKNKRDLVLDSIGDMFVVLTNLREMKQEEHTLIIDANGKPKDIHKLAIQTFKTVGFINTNITINKKLNNDGIYLSYQLNEIAKYYDSSLLECAELAYNEIKDRKGYMRDGVFIKEQDKEIHPEEELGVFIHHK